jgi:hypothetical protein
VFEPARTFALIFALNFNRILTDFSITPGLEESPMHCAYSSSALSHGHLKNLKTTTWEQSRARWPSISECRTHECRFTVIDPCTCLIASTLLPLSMLSCRVMTRCAARTRHALWRWYSDLSSVIMSRSVHAEICTWNTH